MYSPEISWLLESKVPSIRYKTYQNLVGLPADHPVLIEEYRNIQSSTFIQHILDQQVIPGQWKYVNHFYTPKYVSTHWSLLLLEELMIDPNEPRFQQAIDFMVGKTHLEIEERLQSSDSGFTCLWGNILRYVLYAGFIDDPRVSDLITYVSRSIYQNECACYINDHRPCSWGLIRSLWGLSRIPASYRNAEIQKAIDGDSKAQLILAELVGTVVGVPGTVQGAKFVRGQMRGEGVGRSLIGKKMEDIGRGKKRKKKSYFKD